MIKNYVILAVCVLSAFSTCTLTTDGALPILGPSDFRPELVDSDLRNVNGKHTIADFQLMNQNGLVVTQNDYRDKIYVTDFFFTSCPTICPIMTNNMAHIQSEFANDDEIMLLSLSVTPDVDSVSVLRDYATEKGVIDTKWNITTGEKKHIYELARKSFFAVVDQGDGGLQDFIHTPNFILVDKQNQIRGIYDGTSDEDIKRLIEDINILRTHL
jgi:protein SCO1/2